MTFRPELLRAHDFGNQRQSYTRRDAILYALGVGLGGAPQDLAYLDETRLQVLPPFAATLGSPGMWIREPQFGVTFSQLIHLRQAATFHAPLPAEGDVVATARVVSITDRGAGRGAELLLHREISDAGDGMPYATIDQTLLLRADGGFGGPVAEREPSPIPNRLPDDEIAVTLSPRAALIYRLSGDYNPLHADPAVARSGGFERPILHGLCTLGVAGHAVLKTVLGYDPARFAGMRVRFTAPVLPGDTLRTELWVDGDTVSLRTTAVERKLVVLNHGRVDLRPA